MNLLFRHDSGGQLWQGSANDVKELLARENSKIDVIGLFAQEFQPWDPTGRYELIKSGYDDNLRADREEIEKISEVADAAFVENAVHKEAWNRFAIPDS